MRRIYISHPYSGDPQGNRVKVDRICRDIVECGEGLPISPIHLFSFTDDTLREDILAACLDLVGIADEMRVYGTSAGVEMERERAVALGIPVWDVVEGEAF